MNHYLQLTERGRTGNLFKFGTYILQRKYLFTKGLIIDNNVLNVYVLSGRQKVCKDAISWTKTILIQ